jgi:hypothetical protein
MIDRCSLMVKGESLFQSRRVRVPAFSPRSFGAIRRAAPHPAHPLKARRAVGEADKHQLLKYCHINRFYPSILTPSQKPV